MTFFSGPTTTRRTLVSTAFAGAAVISLSREISAQQASPESAEWTFTDDKDVTVTLPSRPEVLVMDVNAAAPLWDFGIRPDALFGWNVLADGSLGDAGGNIEPEGVTIVGDVNETIRLEELIAIDTDLLVTLTWLPDEPDEYWSLDAEANIDISQIRRIAPVVAISASGRADENTSRFAELAAALGADLESPELVIAGAEYKDAIAAFGKVISSKSNLTALFFAPVPDQVYVANPDDWADLNLYQEMGMNIVKPDVAEGEFWESMSHEQALKYPSDVIFYSTRNEAFGIDEIKESPSWRNHPAVKAGQIFGWNQDFIQSYQGMSAALNGIIDALESSSKVI